MPIIYFHHIDCNSLKNGGAFGACGFQQSYSENRHLRKRMIHAELLYSSQETST